MAENWVSVGDNIYVDVSTQERNGDIGFVYAKINGERSKAEFDCKNGILIKLPDLDVSKHMSLVKTMNIACKKWFEVWK